MRNLLRLITRTLPRALEACDRCGATKQVGARCPNCGLGG